jgi:CDP-6-deoxy-D-xylo-4-hexulose-3-dehydrase
MIKKSVIKNIVKFYNNKTPKKKIFYPLKDSSLRDKDLVKGIEVLLSKNVTMGKETLIFEKYFEKKINVKNAMMVNSGSSANLLALQCLINPYRKKRLLPGDEVLIPALCWSTSLWPIVQSGLKPVFVDIDKETLNISIKDLKRKINKKTKALMLVHVLGNSTNMDLLVPLLKRKKIILIEDTCESLGSLYKKKHLGGFGDFSSFSFYYTHQISSIEGGMICTKSKEDADIIKSLRSHGWARGLTNQKSIENANKKINKNFLFYNSGYNLRPTDVNASIGNSQFKDLNFFINKRKINRKEIINSLKKDKRWNNQVHFIMENKNVIASWFGIPMLMNKKFSIRKNLILNKLTKLGIENRPLISGDFTNQPSVRKYKLIKSNLKLPNVKIIDKLGFFIGLRIEKNSNKDLLKFKKAFFKAFK